jgi:DNA polymerase I-like protein with 3'-5' exonuclease and polymerase domains
MSLGIFKEFSSVPEKYRFPNLERQSESEYKASWNILEKIQSSSWLGVDIESDTECPLGMEWKDYGLSHVTDITYISVSTPELDMEGDPVGFVFPIDPSFLQSPEIEWMRQLFSRQDIIFVAHNAVFDFRHLCSEAHTALPVPEHIWCSQVIELLLGVQRYSRVGNNTLRDERSRSLFTLFKYYSGYMLSDPEVYGKYTKLYSKLIIQAWGNPTTREEVTNKLTFYRELFDWYKTMKASRANLNALEPKTLAKYVLIDSYAAVYVAKIQASIIQEFYSTGYYPEIKELLEEELQYIRWSCQSASEGIKADREYMSHVLQQVEDKSIQIYKKCMELYESLGNPEPLRLEGTGVEASLQHLIFEAMKIPKPLLDVDHPDFFTDKGYPSMAADALVRYAKKYPQYAELLLAVRDFTKLKYTHNSVLQFLNHSIRDGRIHSLLKVDAETGRNKSDKPNVQNLPMSYGKVLDDLGEGHEDVASLLCARGYLVADPGYVLLELDYSNAENWMAAMVAADNNLAKACNASDYHTENAFIYYPEQLGHLRERYESGQLTPEEKAFLKVRRSASKPITFGLSYGMGARKLAAQVELPMPEVQAILSNRAAALKRMENMKKDLSDMANKYLTCRLWTGRIVPVGSPIDTYINGQYKRQHFGYKAWNYVCQGGVAELVKRATNQINRFLRKGKYLSRIAMQVHDSLVMQMKIEEYHEIIDSILEIMSNVIPEKFNLRTNPKIKWLVDADHKDNKNKWGWQWNAEYPFSDTGELKYAEAS